MPNSAVLKTSLIGYKYGQTLEIQHHTQKRLQGG